MSFQQYFICYFCFSLWRAISSWVCLKALSIEISKLRPSKLTFTSKREFSISKTFSGGSQKDFDKRCNGACRVGLSQSNEGSIWANQVEAYDSFILYAESWCCGDFKVTLKFCSWL